MIYNYFKRKMVKICSSIYPESSGEKYIEYFNQYSYPLHSFQKFAVEAIVEGHHVLITAPTGSGKTMPADFALDYFARRGKKTIYCSPIKSLSNEKFNVFSKKYPEISIGILTGDIKCNPDAQVLIMTTEILLNKLYQINSPIQESMGDKSVTEKTSANISFEMDFENELACVIFDEIHYINDPSRGTVWEQSILMLPPHIQVIGLSATLDKPEKFAGWIENRVKSNKKVYLTGTNIRAVPLTHYSFITTNSGIFKVIKDKTQQAEIQSMVNKPFIIQSAKGEFNEPHYHKMNSMLKLFENRNVYIKRQHILNQVTKHLVDQQMLPALCFVFSKKILEVCAREVTTVLLEDDSKVPYIVRRECEQILRKMPNYQEYLELPEYINMIALLEKGIAIHHAGVMPILREMVEILFTKGYIKLLFCTETMGIGINMPVKTVIFTGISKFDGNENRILYPHEYTQIAGRAGRLGIDTVGHVIHLNNLFRDVGLIDYKTMMNGKPQKLVSKFKISYNLLFNLIRIGEKDFTSFAKKSMIQGDIDGELKEMYYKMTTLASELENFHHVIANLRSPRHIVERYIELTEQRSGSINKKRKEIDKEIYNISENYVFIDHDKSIYHKYIIKLSEMNQLEREIQGMEKTLNKNISFILDILEEYGFIAKGTQENGENSEKMDYTLTLKGMISSHLREVHCLIFSRIIENRTFQHLSSKQLVSIFSCFTNVCASDEYKIFVPQFEEQEVKNIMSEINNDLQKYWMIEVKNMMSTGSDYNIHYDLISYVIQWCDCQNVEDCKILLQRLETEKGIFLGEFVKALLKINNISSEMESVAEMLGDMEMLSKLREIPQMLLKYVVTNQSLYV